MKRATTAALVALLLLPQAAMTQQMVAWPTQQAPVIDGSLQDEAWSGAVTMTDFSQPGDAGAAVEGVTARMTYDKTFLYVAIVCHEPHPERLRIRHRQDSPDVWQDDSVELFVRTARPGGGDRMSIDQFIVNAAGARLSHRRLASGRQPIPLDWPAAAAVGTSDWTAEFAVPLAYLDLADFEPGRLVEVKFGREDYTGDGVALSVWPAGAEYAGLDGYGLVYFGEPNLLAGATDQGSLNTPRQLLPFTPYRLSAEVQADGGRTLMRAGSQQTARRASGNWQALSLDFATDATGLVELSVEGSAPDGVRLRNLRLVQIPRIADLGPAIAIAGGKPVVITDVAVADARVVRGFVGTAFDGNLQSLAWDGRPWEYPKSGGGAGVGYAYRGNDGLHVILADSVGVDAVQIRGGVRARMFAGHVSWQGPGQQPPVHVFAGNAANSRALFERRVVTDRLSFFDVGDGLLADVGIFRLGRVVPTSRATLQWRAGSHIDAPDAVRRRYADSASTVQALQPSGPASRGSGQPVMLTAGQVHHLLSPEFAAETPIAAVAFDLRVDKVPAAIRLSVQDPVDPRLELMGVDVVLESPTSRIVLDVIDQVLEPGDRLWLSLAAEEDLVLSGSGAEVGPGIRLLTTDRDTAVRQALPYRLFQLKSQFACASEPRPWTQIRYNTDLEAWFASNRWGDQVRQIFDSVEHAWRLDPTNDTVRQYRDWLWQGKRDAPPFAPVPLAAADAPAWAVWARTAWLEARSVAAWWLEHRLVPTGEFGGLVGDDSDLYQNFVDLPFFEDDGVGRQLLDAGARLAELAEHENLTQGLNRGTTDPLHAYEEGVNHEALMAVWHYGDPVYLGRCMVAAAAAGRLTNVTDLGHRHFRSQQVGAAEQDSPHTDHAGYAHPLMWHPAFEVLWYNRHPVVGSLLTQWADGWLQHNEPGRYATLVNVDDERVIETTERPLYGGYGALGSAFAYLAWNTGDTRYLAPFVESFAAGRQGTSPNLLLPELLHRYGAQQILGAPAALKPAGLAATVLHGDTDSLVQALKDDVTELQQFRAMYTSAEPFTDRVFLNALSNVAICYTGGFATRNKYNRSHAVSWSGFGTDYAALVHEAAPGRFRASIYSFAVSAMDGRARFWSLDDGQYLLHVGPDADADHQIDAGQRATRTLVVTRGEVLPIHLPPLQATVLELELVRRHDDTFDRADLALSPLDTEVRDNTVRGMAHNIGRQPAHAVAVLLDPAGIERGRVDLGLLAAPADLEPVSVPWAFEPGWNTATEADGWTVVLEPDITAREIYRGNNSVSLGQARRAAARQAEVLGGLPVRGQ